MKSTIFAAALAVLATPVSAADLSPQPYEAPPAYDYVAPEPVYPVPPPVVYAPPAVVAPPQVFALAPPPCVDAYGYPAPCFAPVPFLGGGLAFVGGPAFGGRHAFFGHAFGGFAHRFGGFGHFR